MAQDTVVLEGSERPAPAGAQLVGTAPDTDTLELTIVVRRRASIPASTGIGPRVSREDFAAQFGADPADIAAVTDYANAQSLTVESTDVARRAVIVSGTMGQMRAAFGAVVDVYQQEGQTFRARTGTLTIPTNLEGVIEGIFGLDERPQARSRLRRLPVRGGGKIAFAMVNNVSYSPTQVAALYQFPAGTGAGQTIGIVELGGGYSQTDLTNYFSGLGISPGPTVLAVSVDGGKNAPSGDPNSADGEVLLDIEVAGAIAPASTIAVYFAPNTTRGFLDAITMAIHDTTNKPSVISISWGGAESTYTGQALQQYDQAFQDAQALGVTICVASGDDGSEDNQTDGQAHVDFPASSPNVLACGGTNLQSSNGTITAETVWNEGAGNGASGGGVSETFPLPSYQTNAGVPPSVNPSAFVGRGVPDVCGDADPATGYNVLVDGNAIVVGGTSAVAPRWAALITLINQQMGTPVGFINPTIYQSAGSFNDITQGNNGAYSAGPGWDACSGLGSPMGMAVLQALQQAVSTPAQPSPAPPDPSLPSNDLT
jgi:kumamolisin